MSIHDSPIGTVPIVWNNADLFDLAPETVAATVLDEIARLGFDGTQFGRGFPEGAELREALAGRSLRFAELYSAVTAGPDGLDGRRARGGASRPRAAGCRRRRGAGGCARRRRRA